MSRTGYPKLEYGQEHGSYHFVNLASGAVASGDYTGGAYMTLHADSVGANTPGWPANKANNPYAGYHLIQRFSPANFTADIRDNMGNILSRGSGVYPFINILGFDPAPLYTAVSLHADMTNKVLQKLISKIKDQKINVGVAVAEFTKTCGTVVNAAQRIASAIRSVKHGNLGAASSTLLGGRPGSRGGSGSGGAVGRKRPKGPRIPPNSGSIASDWLALQYGWKPLLSDVYGACEELARCMTYKPLKFRVDAKSSGEEPFLWETHSVTNTPSLVGKGVTKLSVKGAIEYRTVSSLMQTAANTGIINPLSVAWELIPYSFVVDWFYPVGNYLNSLDYDVGIEFSRGWLSEKCSISRYYKVVPGMYTYQDVDQYWSSGRYDGSITSFSRSVINSFPNVPTPNFKNPVSLGHVSNAIALLRTAF